MEQSKSARAGTGIWRFTFRVTSNGLWAEIVTNYLPGFSECSLAVRRGQDSSLLLMVGLVAVLLLICSSRFVESWKTDIVGTKQFRYFGPCQ